MTETAKRAGKDLREREAIEVLARPFAQSLVTTILEGF